MDEVVGLLLEQFAKKMRGAGGPPVRLAPVARAIPQPQPPQRQAPSAPRRTESLPPPPDPFAGAAAPASALSPLLAAFASGRGLLAGIILSEALAPPVSLRERHPGRS
jgi:hypothetical protein